MTRLLAILAMLAMPVAASAQQTFSASIDAAQAVGCVGGTGTGTGSFTLTGGVLSYNISFSGMTGTETIAHVHGPAAPGATASPVFTLPAGSPKIGSEPLSASEILDLQADLYYVNIHSTQCGGGEIRGQILATSPPVIPVLGGWGFVAMAGVLLGAMFLMIRRHAQAGTAALGA